MDKRTLLAQLRLPLWTAAAFLTGTNVLQAAGKHSHSDHIAVGVVDFPISCNEEAQGVFNHGVAQLHNMMYIEAEEIFNSGALKNPDCAMLYWGVAMSNFHPLWPGGQSDDEVKRGSTAVAKAKELETGSMLEEKLISTVAHMFEKPEDNPYPSRRAKWAAAMADLHSEYPDHTDVTAFHALANLSVADKSDASLKNQAESGALIEQLHAAHPDHPAGFHYMIHAYDNPKFADKAEAISHAYDKIAPEVPHALHMPSHIFVRLGHWPETIKWNERSAAAALKNSNDKTTIGHYAHAIDYLIYAQMQKGNKESAAKLLNEMEAIDNHQQTFGVAYALSASPARVALETEDWATAAKIEPRKMQNIEWERFAAAEGISHFARGIGAAKTANEQVVEESLARLIEIKDSLKKSGGDYWAILADSQWHSVAAWSAYESGNTEKGLELMTVAAELEDSVDKSPVTPGAVLPARELLGDMLLDMAKPESALQAYEAALETSRNRTRSLKGASKAAELMGNKSVADEYNKQVLAVLEPIE